MYGSESAIIFPANGLERACPGAGISAFTSFPNLVREQVRLRPGLGSGYFCTAPLGETSVR